MYTAAEIRMITETSTKVRHNQRWECNIEPMSIDYILENMCIVFETCHAHRKLKPNNSTIPIK